MCSYEKTCHLAGRESCDLQSGEGREPTVFTSFQFSEVTVTPNDLELLFKPNRPPNFAATKNSLEPCQTRSFQNHIQAISPPDSERIVLTTRRFECSANIQSKYENTRGRMARAKTPFKYFLKATQDWSSEYSRNSKFIGSLLQNAKSRKKNITQQASNSSSRHALTAAIATLCLSTATVSSAGGYNNHPSTNPSSVDLKLKLFGKIKPRCEIHLPKEKLWFEITDDADMRAVAFDLNCNQPLKIEVTSRNGGLEHTAHDRLPTYAGFSSFVEYDLNFALQAAGTNDLRFDSEDISNEPGRGHFGAIPYDTTGELKISWAPEKNLIAGTYGDVIEIRVTGDSGSNGHW